MGTFFSILWKAIRSGFYAPIGAAAGAVVGFGLALILGFWMWLASFAWHFDLEAIFEASIRPCILLGAIGGFLSGLAAGFVKEPE